jgi:uncharacterized protein involved in response to NO
VIAALARILTAFDIWRNTLLTVPAATWVLAFAGFAVSFGPSLVKPRQHA